MILYSKMKNEKVESSMTIEKLEYFIYLSKSLNYSETAEHFYTTQSNISKQIMSLEKELDVSLFRREHRTIVLSSAGKAFLSFAKNTIAAYHDMLKIMTPFHNTANHTLHIATLPVMSHYHVPELFSQFHKKHCDILLDIKDTESVQMFPALDDGIFDIICTRLFHLPGKKYETIIFDQDVLAVVVPEKHPLANYKSLSLQDLRNEEFYQLDENTNQFQVIRTACLEAGFEPKIAYSGTRIDNILSFVSSDMGISLLMRHSVESLHYPGIKVIPLTKPIKSKLAFVRLKKDAHSDACNRFWHFLSLKFD